MEILHYDTVIRAYVDLSGVPLNMPTECIFDIIKQGKFIRFYIEPRVFYAAMELATGDKVTLHRTLFVPSDPAEFATVISQLGMPSRIEMEELRSPEGRHYVGDIEDIRQQEDQHSRG